MTENHQVLPGKPIYGQLVSHDVTDILAVVVRSFGGTLLGKGGLINAYRSATADMLSHAVIVQKFLEEHFRVRFPYDRLNAVMKVLKEENLIPRQPEYDAECILNFMVRKHRAPRCAELLKAISGVMLETQK